MYGTICPLPSVKFYSVLTLAPVKKARYPGMERLTDVYPETNVGSPFWVLKSMFDFHRVRLWGK